MLTLQRKVGESIFIGEDIEVRIVSLDSAGRIRLSIDAPQSYRILRSELRSAMQVNQEAAQEASAPDTLLDFLGTMFPQSP